MAAKEKEVGPDEHKVIIYYCKNYRQFSEPFDMDNHVKVCEWSVLKAEGHMITLERMFEIFNWVRREYQPDTEEVGFDRGEADHTSMSVGDLVDIDGIKYRCDSIGWQKVA